MSERYVVISAGGHRYDAELREKRGTKTRLSWQTECYQFTRWFHGNGKEVKKAGDWRFPPRGYKATHRFEVVET